jgi:hypothetical protein
MIDRFDAFCKEGIEGLGRNNFLAKIICLIILSLFLFLIDIISTSIVLENKGFEMNPLMISIVTSIPYHLLIKGLSLIIIIVLWALFSQKVIPKFFPSDANKNFIKGAQLLGLMVVPEFYTIVLLNNFYTLSFLF